MVRYNETERSCDFWNSLRLPYRCWKAYYYLDSMVYHILRNGSDNLANIYTVSDLIDHVSILYRRPAWLIRLRIWRFIRYMNRHPVYPIYTKVWRIKPGDEIRLTAERVVYGIYIYCRPSVLHTEGDWNPDQVRMSNLVYGK